MLGEGKYRGIIASTLAEICGVLPLARNGLLDEVSTCAQKHADPDARS